MVALERGARIHGHARGHRDWRGENVERRTGPARRNEDGRGQRDQIAVVVHERDRDAAGWRRIQQRHRPQDGAATDHALVIERDAPQDWPQTE